MEFLGYLARVGTVEADLLVGFFYGTIVRCWESCEWFIMAQRRVRITKYGENFEWLAQRAREHLKREYDIDDLGWY